MKPWEDEHVLSHVGVDPVDPRPRGDARHRLAPGEGASALSWRRGTLLVAMSALLLTIGLAGRADAAFVSSKCETRGGGTQGNNYVDVCVRLETYSGTNGLPSVRGYGAMDYRGAEPFFHRLEILALHVRVYYPAQGGPQKDYITSNYQDGYGYINLRTNDGFVQQCGYGYKAVMTYRIHWQSGAVTTRSNFYTPGGTVRWEPPGC
jgi:hypothetical protein